jgi:hypothetical protein
VQDDQLELRWLPSSSEKVASGRAQMTIAISSDKLMKLFQVHRLLTAEEPDQFPVKKLGT